MTRIVRRGPRPNDIPRNYECIECHKPKSARKPNTRCTKCSEAHVLEERRRRWREERAKRFSPEREAAKRAKRERDHQVWLTVRARVAEAHKARLPRVPKVVRVEAHGVEVPYDQMTKRVERETGTDSNTWNMIDPRWDRVVYLTRALLGIPHEAPKNLRGMNHRDGLDHDHDQREEAA